MGALLSSDDASRGKPIVKAISSAQRSPDLGRDLAGVAIIADARYFYRARRRRCLFYRRRCG